MSRRMHVLGAALVLAAVLGVSSSAQLGSLLKGGGVAFVVSKFGKDINKFINGLTKTPDQTEDYKTKVVPIISVGSGKEAGACQVMGPPEAVDRVQAVAQLEGGFRLLSGLRVRALIPVATKGITNIKRVPGVGISGLVDIKI